MKFELFDLNEILENTLNIIDNKPVKLNTIKRLYEKLNMITIDDIEKNLYFLLVKRKDSMGKTGFIRGQYELNDIEYIIKLISTMTINERKSILVNNFDYLWNDIWRHNYKKGSLKDEYKKSKRNLIS